MKIGILGGTFDPIHNAHLFIAESARLREGLELVLFVPTNGHHYRTPPIASVEDRCAMVRAAIADNPAFLFDETDIRYEATGYTADLIPALRARYPHASFTFIAGADSLVNAQWKRFDEVLASLERFVVAPRPGVSGASVERVIESVSAPLREKILLLNVPELLESGTLVRQLLAARQSVRYLVPESVWNYIEQRRLYES